ncbi:MAG: branched-chain amino acid transport system II carrier protein, partial [Alphaproteobacteria bacterium]|nr:branched-chain amino acid transport system II carrier protein [Alphaproteobacteria bacterium]
MKQYKLICVYGFAIFAMFFGSGNLVFPLQLGQHVGKNWFLGFLGLLSTGIVLPFLGLFVIKLHKGNYRSFFAEGGKMASIILPFFTLSLLGSFGVVPRCITVAH